MSRYARKVDNNHSQFTSYFRKCGVPFQDTSRWPGMLDFIVQTRRGRLVRLEVKTDEGEPLTDREAITFRMFPGACYRVWDVEQVQPIIFDEEDK